MHDNTRQWAGKTSSKKPNDWKPFRGKFKVIKLPRNAGITPEMTEFPQGRNITGSYRDGGW